MLKYLLEDYALTRMEGFTLGLTVKKEVLKVVSCSVSLTLTLNLETDTLFEELKKVTSTMTPQKCVI